MAKRSDFERISKDKYRTPPEAVLPLLPHLRPRTHFVEPCAGDGRLARHLEDHGHRCLAAYDIEPEGRWVPAAPEVRRADASLLRWTRPGDAIWITNPPWRRDWLHPIILNLCQQAPAWLLFDADWAHTIQWIPYKPYCRKIVSAGRIEWIEGSGQTAKDNAAWYLFTPEFSHDPPPFYGPE
jgi:hypothetical protein